MNDLIDRQATIDAMENTDWYHQNQNGEMVHGASSEDQAWYKAEDVYGVLERAPSVHSERKKGTWLPIIETNEFGEPYQSGVHCSRCGHATVYETSFCPDCGVIMDGNPTVKIYTGNRSEFPNNSDCVSKRAAVEAIANQSRFSAEEIINICDKSVQDENVWLGGLKEAILAVLELPSAQPEADLQPTCNQLATDLISRQAVIDILEVAINDDWEFDYAKDRMIELSAQPERKKGEWTIDEDCEGKSRTVTCNLCGYEEFNWYNPNFCPNCGADMKNISEDQEDACSGCDYYDLEDNNCRVFECFGIDCPRLPYEEETPITQKGDDIQ